jgi:hypothetical protein
VKNNFVTRNFKFLEVVGLLAVEGNVLHLSNGFSVDIAVSIQITQSPLISKICTPNSFNSQDPWLNKGAVIGVLFDGKGSLASWSERGCARGHFRDRGD